MPLRTGEPKTLLVTNDIASSAVAVFQSKRTLEEPSEFSSRRVEGGSTSSCITGLETSWTDRAASSAKELGTTARFAGPVSSTKNASRLKQASANFAEVGERGREGDEPREEVGV